MFETQTQGVHYGDIAGMCGTTAMCGVGPERAWLRVPVGPRGVSFPPVFHFLMLCHRGVSSHVNPSPKLRACGPVGFTSQHAGSVPVPLTGRWGSSMRCIFLSHLSHLFTLLTTWFALCESGTLKTVALAEHWGSLIIISPALVTGRPCSPCRRNTHGEYQIASQTVRESGTDNQ